jgi:hypothetical protein
VIFYKSVKTLSRALGWLFIGSLFRPFLPAGQIDSYIAALISPMWPRLRRSTMKA